MFSGSSSSFYDTRIEEFTFMHKKPKLQPSLKHIEKFLDFLKSELGENIRNQTYQVDFLFTGYEESGEPFIYRARTSDSIPLKPLSCSDIYTSCGADQPLNYWINKLEYDDWTINKCKKLAAFIICESGVNP